MKRSLSLLLGSFLILGACDDDPTGSRGGTLLPGDSAIQVLGLGKVTERYTGEVWVEGSYGYSTSWGRRSLPGNGMYVWNVRGDEPLLVNTLTVSDALTLGDVQASDDGKLLVVATEYAPGSIVVFDRTDPANPRQLSRFSSASTHAGVHTAEVARVNGKLYAFLSIDPSRSSAPRLVIVDLSDPAAPREVLSREMGNPYIHDVFVRDGLLFTALWDAGMTIWDIGGGGKGGTVANPVQVGNIQTVDGSVHNIFWYHDPQTGSKRYTFVGEEDASSARLGSSSAGDVHVVDVSDLANPREVAFYHVPGAGSHNFSVDEKSGVLYAAFYNAGVRALDIRGDLGSCAADQKDSLGRCDLMKMGREIGRGLTSKPAAEVQKPYVWGVHLSGGALYASDMLNGLWKLDVSALRR